MTREEQIKRAAEAIRSVDAETKRYFASSKGTFLGILCGRVDEAVPDLGAELYSVVYSALDEVYGKGKWEKFTDKELRRKVRIVSNAPQESPENTGKEPPAEKNNEHVGTCPKCGAEVRDNGRFFSCAKNTGKNSPCNFGIRKIILTRDINTDEIRDLLANRKTPLLAGFVSNRTGNTFSAHLIIKDDGEMGFDFPPRRK